MEASQKFMSRSWRSKLIHGCGGRVLNGKMAWVFRDDKQWRLGSVLQTHSTVYAYPNLLSIHVHTILLGVSYYCNNIIGNARLP